MTANTPLPDDPEAAHLALDEMDRHWRGECRKMLALAVAVAVSIALLIALGPWWLQTLTLLVTVSWAVRQLWWARPGRCATCGKRSMMGFYRSGRKVERAWWQTYLFGTPRFDRYCCVTHLPEMLHEKVHELLPNSAPPTPTETD